MDSVCILCGFCAEVIKQMFIQCYVRIPSDFPTLYVSHTGDTRSVGLAETVRMYVCSVCMLFKPQNPHTYVCTSYAVCSVYVAVCTVNVQF